MQGMKIMKEKAARKVWVDYLKVLGMVSIVWGHCAPTHFSSFAYAFDVQLFFWVSGYLTKNRFVPWGLFARKTWRTLLLPMLLICMIALCLSALMSRSSWMDLPKSMLLVLAGFHSFYGIAGCGAMWFVYSLIIIRGVHNLMVSHPKYQPFLYLIFMSLAFWWQSQGYNTASAWINVLQAYLFFCLGNWCANGLLAKLRDKLTPFTPPPPRLSDMEKCNSDSLNNWGVCAGSD